MNYTEQRNSALETAIKNLLRVAEINSVPLELIQEKLTSAYEMRKGVCVDDFVADAPPPPKKVVVEWSKPCSSGNRVGWGKVWTALQEDERGAGYLFGGEWLSEGENLLAVGDLIVECVPAGSVKHARKEYRVRTVTETGLSEPYELGESTGRKHSFMEAVAHVWVNPINFIPN